MKIGYARVSTQDQNIDLQLDALKKYGCSVIYQEKKSGKNSERPELKKMLQTVREGDVLVIWKLDRLGRSLKDLVQLVGQLQEKKVDFVSLQDSINTSTPQGRLFFHSGAAFAEFEREIIRERTLAGLASARARGRIQRAVERSKQDRSCCQAFVRSKTILRAGNLPPTYHL